ncbi:hypothetical protein JY651_28670 [Pyxidicoccus parkwayensis]|uniref:Uncharacterized protein n=1 Tax=Pyxidicoccus parkwayensis TaxID=2813578 RepID=A0ABX7NPI8_9BACT|nr:hypothetical protein [Pyxidicoccus parkwaysis]QSQ19306.1 hypothetical protein JY651_28670 [Pyxidicoccus parkwaysis]
MKKRITIAAVLAAVLAAPVAFAQAIGSQPEPSLKSIILSAIVTATPVVATALAGLVAAALLALTRKLQAQAGESKLAQVGARASMVAEAIVRDVEVTLKPKLEAAASDGVLTPDELKKLKDEALAELKRSLGERGLAELQDVLKLTAGSVGTFLSGLIEAALDRMKASRAPATADEVINAALSLGAIGSQAALAPVAAVPQTPRG